MATHFVIRHLGTRRWARSHGISVDFRTAHLDVATVEPGDVVIGALPIQLAAEVQRRQAGYLHLSIDLPAELRGHPAPQ